LFGKKKESVFFNDLCVSYYAKILSYCYAKLNNESLARDSTQDTFLIALQKISILQKHPNPGGFLFQTAKNIIKEKQRSHFKQMMVETEIRDDQVENPVDLFLRLEEIADKQIDESNYAQYALSQLSEEKSLLYSLYYTEQKSMKEIASILGIKETTARMRYVRLRREIRSIVTDIAEKHFIS
jgi:RNA polymerase sigma-70 factor (ECF subfamily)